MQWSFLKYFEYNYILSIATIEFNVLFFVLVATKQTMGLNDSIYEVLKRFEILRM